MLSAAHVLDAIEKPLSPNPAPWLEVYQQNVYQPHPITPVVNNVAELADMNWANDAGLARLRNGIPWSNDIYDVGPIGGIDKPRENEDGRPLLVRKQGKNVRTNVWKSH